MLLWVWCAGEIKIWLMCSHLKRPFDLLSEVTHTFEKIWIIIRNKIRGVSCMKYCFEILLETQKGISFHWPIVFWLVAIYNTANDYQMKLQVRSWIKVFITYRIVHLSDDFWAKFRSKWEKWYESNDKPIYDYQTEISCNRFSTNYWFIFRFFSSILKQNSIKTVVVWITIWWTYLLIMW